MSGRTLNVIIAVCVIASTAAYFRTMRKLDKDTEKFNNALIKWRDSVSMEEK